MSAPSRRRRRPRTVKHGCPQGLRDAAGIPLAPVYAPDSLAARHAAVRSGARPRPAGRVPVHARRAGHHVPRPPWTMRQYAGFGTAAESNQRYKLPARAGQTGLSVAFDLPTQMGRDPDHPLARGEVGRVGVAIDSLDDMRVLLDGIPLADVSTSMTINATAATLLALYVAVADEHGVPRDAAVAARSRTTSSRSTSRAGRTSIRPRPSMRLITDTFAFCQARGAAVEHDLDQRLPHPRGRLRRGPGGRVHARRRHRLRRGGAARPGSTSTTFAPRLSFFFNVHNNLLEEVAKFRAARRLWARIMRERFGAKDPTRADAALPRADRGLDAARRSSRWSTSCARPSQALAAVLGGAQSLHTNSYDEALGAADRGRGALALRTQQVIGHETGVADFVDPARRRVRRRGADDRDRGARRRADRRDRRARRHGARDRGGLPAARDRAPRVRAPARGRARRAHRRRRQPLRRCGDGGLPPLHKLDPALESAQVARLAETRTKRDGSKTRAALDALASAARGTDNLIPPILAAVKTRATLGEIADVLRNIFGEYHPA